MEHHHGSALRSGEGSDWNRPAFFIYALEKGGHSLTYIAPQTIESAVQSLQEPAKIVAGCTDYFPALKGPPPERILDVSGIDAMVGIESRADGWWIGAATPWTDVINHPLPPAFDCLKAAAREVGSIQIQNAGTVAGNLCNASPAADGVPPLLALDSAVDIVSSAGKTSLPLADFITGPRQITLRADELVTAVRVPRISDRATSTFIKLGARKYLVISIAMIAVVCAVDPAGTVIDLRIAIGACSPVATRLQTLEKSLINQQAERLLKDLSVPPAALESLAPIDDVRGTAAYRLKVARELCQRAIRTALEDALEARK